MTQNSESLSAAAESTQPPCEEKPKFGVRIGRGIVTYWADYPITTWQLADEVRQAILDLTGERGEIEEVFVL